MVPEQSLDRFKLLRDQGGLSWKEAGGALFCYFPVPYGSGVLLGSEVVMGAPCSSRGGETVKEGCQTKDRALSAA